MRTALITTTINTPRVLELYRAHSEDVRFFVAGDKKTPVACGHFLETLPNTKYLPPVLQEEWKCSELLGWNNDSRRNIALLEALRWGAEIIISVDDDMIPVGDHFFDEIEKRLRQPFHGLEIGEEGYWTDIGKFTVPPVPQRGLPARFEFVSGFSAISGAQVGAMQGVILGVPDTDAMTAISTGPTVLGATDILRNGFVVQPGAFCVFNSQFTAFRRELAPCFAQFYKWQQRNTDIFASLVMRRVMQEKGLYTYFGPPFGFHARSPRIDPLKDLLAEQFGLQHVQQFAEWLERLVFTNDKPLARQIYERTANLGWWPKECTEAALAFMDDVERVL